MKEKTKNFDFSDLQKGQLEVFPVLNNPGN